MSEDTPEIDNFEIKVSFGGSLIIVTEAINAEEALKDIQEWVTEMKAKSTFDDDLECTLEINN